MGDNILLANKNHIQLLVDYTDTEENDYQILFLIREQCTRKRLFSILLSMRNIIIAEMAHN